MNREEITKEWQTKRESNMETIKIKQKEGELGKG